MTGKLPVSKDKDVKKSSASIAELANKKNKVVERIKAQTGTDTKDSCGEVANPFSELSEDGKAKLNLRGIDVARLSKMHARLLTGKHFGDNAKTFINQDPDTILIVCNRFGTHGDIYSAGPILAVGDSLFMGKVIGAELVWCVDQSVTQDEVVGLPLIVAPTVNRSHAKFTSEDVWYGNYGWRPPKGFMNYLKEP